MLSPFPGKPSLIPCNHPPPLRSFQILLSFFLHWFSQWRLQQWRREKNNNNMDFGVRKKWDQMPALLISFMDLWWVIYSLIICLLTHKMKITISPRTLLWRLNELTYPKYAKYLVISNGLLLITTTSLNFVTLIFYITLV